MKITIAALSLGLVVVAGRSGIAQHDGHQMPGTSVDACRESAQQAVAVIDAANQRLELARQTNNLAEMRAAVDALQSALVQIRSQLGPCAVNATGSMAGMAHTMPNAQQAPTAPASSNASTISDIDIALTSRPSPPRVGANEFEVTVKRKDGTPIADVVVSVLFVMPAMPQMKMPEMRNEVKLASAGGGKFAGNAPLMMAGTWNVTVIVTQAGKEIAQKPLTITAR